MSRQCRGDAFRVGEGPLTISIAQRKHYTDIIIVNNIMRRRTSTNVEAPCRNGTSPVSKTRRRTKFVNRLCYLALTASTFYFLSTKVMYPTSKFSTSNGGSADATVIGMATNYRLSTYTDFVGSLRKTGYEGHIILGVSPKKDSEDGKWRRIPDDVKAYLLSQNVTMKHIQYVPCEHKLGSEGCAHPYPDIKSRWSRFPLARDWLEECATCTGPVLITDVRDSFFQENPFGTTSDGQDPPVVEGLQVFEENPIQTTDHWLVEWPVRECKNITFRYV